MAALHIQATSMLDSCFDRHAEFAELEQVVMWGEPVDALKQKQSEALIKLFELCAEEARKLLADLKRAEEERRAAEAARLLNEREEEERMIREMRTEAMAEAAAHLHHSSSCVSYSTCFVSRL